MRKTIEHTETHSVGYTSCDSMEELCEKLHALVEPRFGKVMSVRLDTEVGRGYYDSYEATSTLSISYERQETAEEEADRLEKATKAAQRSKEAATRAKVKKEFDERQLLKKLKNKYEEKK